VSKREFKLPLLSQLTKEQQRILRLPLEGQHIVVGAPGTGKSVIALHRLAKYNNGEKPLFLTFNHVLQHSTVSLDKTASHFDTAMSFLYKTQYELTNEFMPESEQTATQKKVREMSPDYEKLKEIFESHYEHYKSKNEIYDIVIDEAQDLPSGFYESLMHLGFENFFVVADQNQQITLNNSSRSELEAVFDIETNHVHELTQNHRNTGPIAKLAQYFYTDRASPLPELPNKPSIDTPTLINYTSVQKCVENILREADNGPGKLIGVIVPTEVKREDYVKKLKMAELPKRRNGSPIVSTYSSNQKQGNVNIPFDQGGIVVLCDKSVKGIEFDTVYVILDGLQVYNGDETAIKKRLYVMFSRAIDKLFIMQSDAFPNNITPLLPTDEAILKRKVI
jgi:DNA helicase IV